MLSEQLLLFTEWPKNFFDFFLYFLFIICILMIIATLIGNALVILAVMLVRKLRHPSNLLLVSLAIADFCVGLIVMPLGIIELFTKKWILGPVLCCLWTSTDQALCTASIINLCMISVDRYLAVSRPLRYSAQRTLKRILAYIAIVWVAALIVSISPLIVFPAVNNEGLCQVNQNPIYQIYATIIAFYGPSCIMTCLYAKMWLAAKRLAIKDATAKNSLAVEKHKLCPNKHNSDTDTTSTAINTLKHTLNNDKNKVYYNSLSINNNNNNTSNSINDSSNDCSFSDDSRISSTYQYSFSINRNLSNNDSNNLLNMFYLMFKYVCSKCINVQLKINRRAHERSEGKARKTLGVMLSVFIACWLPFFIIALLKAYRVAVPSWIDHLTLWIGYFNSLMNPIIYCKYNRDFYVPFREMLCCRFCTLKEVMRRESFTNKYGPTW
uniref:G_PROTEIN_RECEP_F1_2 domain-containing protein n=1 Tax=Syphacia muris TaxID=451379 RepID=A0A0N5AGA4_9BILA